jgi:hypothetical protein
VEFALVLPLFLMVLFGIIILGIGVFYQQQLTNAAREAARYAVIHSASSDCPTFSWKPPAAIAVPGGVIYPCDPPPGWPQMTSYARGRLIGIPRNDVMIAACWSGYWTKDGSGNWAAWDAPPVEGNFRSCTMGGIDPRTDTSSLPCPVTTTYPDDMASDLATSTGKSANQVTVYTCYQWRPPLAGFLLIPSTIHLRAVITEGMEYQQ